jgi:hypothetical protein
MKIKVTFSEYSPAERVELIELIRKKPGSIAFSIYGETHWEKEINRDAADSSHAGKIDMGILTK